MTRRHKAVGKISTCEPFNNKSGAAKALSSIKKFATTMMAGRATINVLFRWFFVFLISMAQSATSLTISSQPRKAVILPGFLSGSDEFQELATILQDRHGIETMVVPLKTQTWVPCLGGRSVRPILERLDCTIRAAVAASGVPNIEYSFADWWSDVRTNPGGDLKIGGSDQIDEYPVVQPAGTFPSIPISPTEKKNKIILIGHSAGGWISRMYCSNRSYGGRSYNGSEFVHTLVTLGTPHAEAPGPAFYGIEWCNREADEDYIERKIAVAGTGFSGNGWGAMTTGAYNFCGFDDPSTDGDGVTPIQSALAWKGAKQCVVENTTHFPWSDVAGASLVAPELTKDHREGRNWYGSKTVVDQWVKRLNDS